MAKMRECWLPVVSSDNNNFDLLQIDEGSDYSDYFNMNMTFEDVKRGFEEWSRSGSNELSYYEHYGAVNVATGKIKKMRFEIVVEED